MTSINMRVTPIEEINVVIKIKLFTERSSIEIVKLISINSKICMIKRNLSYL